MSFFPPLFRTYLAFATASFTTLGRFKFSMFVANLLNIEHRRNFLVSGKQD